eukprot:5478860-Amphidinium_carterae.1
MGGALTADPSAFQTRASRAPWMGKHPMQARGFQPCLIVNSPPSSTARYTHTRWSCFKATRLALLCVNTRLANSATSGYRPPNF